MKFWRAFLVFLEIGLFGVGALTIGGIIFPLLSLFIKEDKRREYFSGIIHSSWKFFIWVIESTKVVKVNTNGDLSKIKGKIVVASHPSLIDIILLINPVMRNIVKSLYIINDVEPEIFQKNALEALNEGYNIVIFPTGTRTLPGEDIKIHKGAAQLAIISGANIVPINIKTDFPFLRKHHSPLDAGEKTVNYYLKILPEIDTKDYNIDTVGEIKARNHISAKIKECIN